MKEFIDPARPLLQKYYKRKMDQYMGKVLDERFSGRGANAQGGKRSRTGIDLALEEYLKESGKDVDMKTVTMDAEFRRYAIDNLLTLLFAGHDTTASTISYCYYHLGKDPERLERLRQELDDVFGTDVDAAEQLRNDPYLINKCEYTLAVIKEVSYDSNWHP
jgi:acid phosphatase